jgi:hypothetical protein
LKSVLVEVLPFTTEVITSRGGMFENFAISVSYVNPKPSVIQQGRTFRRVDDSWLEMILPFSEHEGLRETMMKTDGKSIRYGKLFELLDALAADVAYRHCGGREASGLTIVTAAVDELKLYSEISLLNSLTIVWVPSLDPVSTIIQ